MALHSASGVGVARYRLSTPILICSQESAVPWETMHVSWECRSLVLKNAQKDAPAACYKRLKEAQDIQKLHTVLLRVFKKLGRNILPLVALLLSFTVSFSCSMLCRCCSRRFLCHSCSICSCLVVLPLKPLLADPSQARWPQIGYSRSHTCWLI